MSVFATIVVALLFSWKFGSVESIDFTTLFVRNSTDLNRAIASDCITFNNRRKCKLNTKNIKLNEGDAIEIVGSTNGDSIRCRKRLNRKKGRWYGSCDGDARDANFISRDDGKGKKSIFGSIHIGNDICQIAPSADGDEEMNCIPSVEFMDEDLSMDVPDEALLDRGLTSQYRFGFTPSRNQNHLYRSLRVDNRPNSRRQLYDDLGGNVDVLVVWTKKAECNNAGLPSGCTLTDATENKMRGLIDLAVAETNTAFELSGMFSTLRLVHAYRDPIYVESTDMKKSLKDITGTGDGILDGVHVKRALYGADVVQMIVGDELNCGVGWRSTIPIASHMFSVTKYSCATGYYAFGHEIGHNFNMQHDRGTVGTCSEANTYNYGYRDPKAEYMTILSYSCKVGQCDNMPKNGCTRIQRFSNSNPSYTYNGKPIGDAKSDNAKQFNNQRSLVASFYPAMDCISNNECNDGDSTTVDTCNTATSVCVFKAKVSSDDALPAFMETLKVTGVRSPVWTLVTLSKSYVSPIPVCTVMYDLGTTLQPAIVRIRKIGSTSFEVRIQNPSNSVLSGRDVHCVVVEEGSWTLPDGRPIESKRFNSTVTDRKAIWVGQAITFQNSYSNPVVLGQVLTYNDARWSVFWSRLATGQMGKHIGEDSRTTRNAEMIGYIVIESGHDAKASPIEFETGRGPDVFTSYVGSKIALAYQTKFSSTPVVAVVSQASMDGPDGSWAVVTTANFTTSLGISVDEDQNADEERYHVSEIVHYAVFSSQGAISLVRR